MKIHMREGDTLTMATEHGELTVRQEGYGLAFSIPEISEGAAFYVDMFYPSEACDFAGEERPTQIILYDPERQDEPAAVGRWVPNHGLALNSTRMVPLADATITLNQESYGTMRRLLEEIEALGASASASDVAQAHESDTWRAELESDLAALLIDALL